MKISILIPNEEYRSNAGARIRYGRLATALAAHHIRLSVNPIDQFDPAMPETDMLLLSKCYDARSLLMAEAANHRGVPVGLDLFDDYFSQKHDARLARFRQWLSDLAPSLSFILASTKLLINVAREYAPNVAAHIVRDPAEPGDGCARVADASSIEAKLEYVKAHEKLNLAWFGIGDNPYFPIGLDDLFAFAGHLSRLNRESGYPVHLTVLTNARALSAQALARLRGMPVPTRVQQWSAESEADLLSDSFACFLPVNAQPFSAAKSLNRAISALAAGCQVLSSGYPLYAEVDELIYRDAKEMADDIQRGMMRVGAARRERLVALIEQWASAGREASRLAQFLTGLGDPRAGRDRAALVHGTQTTVAVGHLARRIGVPSIASPFAPPGLNADYSVGLATPFQIELQRGGKWTGGTPILHRRSRRNRLQPIDVTNMSLGAQLALCPRLMATLRDQLRSRLGVNRVLLSEGSALRSACMAWASP